MIVKSTRKDKSIFKESKGLLNKKKRDSSATPQNDRVKDSE